jgi:hypothetical protein
LGLFAAAAGFAGNRPYKFGLCVQSVTPEVADGVASKKNEVVPISLSSQVSDGDLD